VQGFSLSKKISTPDWDDQLGATGVLEASLSDRGLRALELFNAGSPFGKVSWEIEFIGERNEIRGKPHV
jgi:hypothetical protein